MLTRLRLLLTALAIVLLVPRPALAIEYEVFIDVDSEDELYDLLVTEQISEDTFDILLELRRRGVDLNTATRDQLYSLPNLTYEDVDAILAYRAEVGIIHAPADLAAAGVLSRAKLGAILTFIQASEVAGKWTATHGSVRYQTAWSQADNTVPPMLLQARVTTLRQLTIGVTGLMLRQETDPPVWDPVREALVAPELGPRLRVPRAFVEWNGEKLGVIVGNYQVGFAQRLTMDTTSRYTPNGMVVEDANRIGQDLTRRCRQVAGELPDTPCPEDDDVYYTTKDFYWREAFRGVALGAKHLSLPVGWLQAYGFGSWQSRKQYQYNVMDKRTCDDPFNCASVPLLVHDEDDPLAPTTGHRWATMPDLYDEFLGGGNFSWFYDRRTHIGVTGYGANVLWRVDGADLDFKGAARTPFGGPFGAVGVDAAWGRGWSDIGIELSRSFDSQKTLLPETSPYGGGGYAGIVRQTSTFGTHEIELSARYYDKNYDNPYASPISQPDTFLGLRARDEAGGRVRYGGIVRDRLNLRALADIWVQPSILSPKIQAYVRGDVDVNKWFRPGLWLEYRDVDMRPNSLVGCISEDLDIEGDFTVELDEGNDNAQNLRYGCRAQVGKITGRLNFRPWKGKLSLLAQYRHDFVDDTSVDYLRHDGNFMFTVRANPVAGLNLSARLRFRAEDIHAKDRLEESVWTYFSVSYLIKKAFLIHVRYDLYDWLDTRDSTANRVPNPEHRLRLELEARF
jgi:hypothetical protein